MNRTKIPIYQKNLDNYNSQLKRVKSQHAKISWLRLIVFLAVLLSWLYIITLNVSVGVISGLSFMVIFAFLLKKHKKLEDRKKYLEIIVRINSNEIESCSGDFSVFEPGDEFTDHNHAYSYDIDLFGRGSLFQYLNRTVTIKGKNLLAYWLGNTPLSNSKILNNQIAIKELSLDLDFMQEYRTIGSLFASESEEEEFVNRWINHPMFFSKRLLIQIILYAVPVLNFTVLGLVIYEILNISSIVWLIFINLMIIGSKLKSFNSYYSLVSKSHLILKKVSKLIAIIEKKDFEGDLLIEMKNRLFSKDVSANNQINQLTKLIDGLDNRNNMILGVVLNSFLLWDWQYLSRIERWQQNHKMDFSSWLKSIAEFDALISLANLNYNNPDFSFPEISDNNFELTAVNIGHPLLPSELRVCNDFAIEEKPRYAIVTGANMAGKSTFLRTVAANLILAGCGGPVCAEKLKFKPIPIHSSMRAEDSLMKNESYFFAELKRLQRITNELDKGEKLFIILDEILRGTNSEDKRKGSIGFIKKITEKMAFGLVATHDLELARLAEQKPDIFKALCFEVIIKNNELQFDYKLQPGVTKNMNASFLMHRMGIIDE